MCSAQVWEAAAAAARSRSVARRVRGTRDRRKLGEAHESGMYGNAAPWRDRYAGTRAVGFAARGRDRDEGILRSGPASWHTANKTNS